MTCEVVIGSMYTKAHRDIDGAVKARVLDFVTKLQHDPTSPGLDVKPPKGAVDHRVRTARVSDFWRAVLFELPKRVGYILVAVKPHDAAYDYAAQLKMAVNAATGALEVIDRLAIDEAMADAAPPDTPPEARDAAPDDVASDLAKPSRPLLDGLSRQKLLAFGIEQDVAERALSITDDQAFEALCEALPELQGCALLDLRAGKDPDAVYQDLVGSMTPEVIDTDDVLTALDRPSSRLQFATGDNEELLAAIEGDLQAWRIWLHPLQRTLAYHDGWNGPFRVTGGAGTGKTVTALHRARHLAERMGDGAEGRVLVATYTKNLAEALRQQFRELAGTETAAKVDIVNLDALAYRLLNGASTTRPRLVSDDDEAVQQAWAIAAAGSDWEPGFLADEWLDVVLANGIADRAGYLKAARPGRGTPLNRARRIDVWRLIEKATQHLAVAGVIPYTQAASRAADVAAADPTLRYRHAIIDEAQDLHPAHWRLVRALVDEGQDDLFIVGDAHQRIYGRPLVLSRYGIRTQGRSRRLTVNYRTSQEILRWCLMVMTGTDVDDLEGDTDTLAGARSEFRGPSPTTLACAGPADEDTGAVTQVRAWIDEGYPAEGIAVLSRTTAALTSVQQALESAGIPAVQISRGDATPTPGSVQVMTMHRAKGLEFRCVAITRLGADAFPPSNVRTGSADEQAVKLARERALLYVAGSRARERLALLYSGTPTALLG